MGTTPEQFCAQYAAKVARFASFAAGRDADPEDIAQDALLKAIHALDRYDRDRGSMDAWLWRIVVNTARDAMRGARLRALLAERLAPDQPTADVEESAIERVTSSELYEPRRRARPSFSLGSQEGQRRRVGGSDSGQVPLIPRLVGLVKGEVVAAHSLLEWE